MFFTADHHFGHANIIPQCRRPFNDVREMDEAMVERWNAVVKARDDIWHVGDFAYRAFSEATDRTFRRLHGRKRLIIGNHDRQSTRALPWAEPPAHLAVLKEAGSRIVLCHYGLRVWPSMHHGTISLYGHSHGRLPGHSRALDVGVDNWDFFPVSIDQIRERLATLPAYTDPEIDL